MPMLKVYLRKGSTAEHKRAVSDAIHATLMEVLGIPSDDKYHVFHELDADDLITVSESFGVERRPERMIFVQFYFGPRPKETLHLLFERVAEAITSATDLELRDVALNVIESPSPNWWISGRVVDPKTGFDVRISADKVPPVI